jgi:hypothetical protein
LLRRTKIPPLSEELCGLDVLVVDYHTDGAEETYHVP